MVCGEDHLGLLTRQLRKCTLRHGIVLQQVNVRTEPNDAFNAFLLRDRLRENQHVRNHHRDEAAADVPAFNLAADFLAGQVFELAKTGGQKPAGQPDSFVVAAVDVIDAHVDLGRVAVDGLFAHNSWV